MARIATQDFTLLRDDCRPLDFKAGEEIPAEYAEHWFVLHHTEEQTDAVDDGADEVKEKRKPARPPKA